MFGDFRLFQFMFFAVFAAVIGMFLFAAVNGIRRWNKNERSPRLSVPATVVAKRTSVSRHHHTGAGGLHHSHMISTHYATFQVDSGDRIELCVGEDIGMLVEGDRGMLHFQGTRYLGFDRRYPQNQGEMQ